MRKQDQPNQYQNKQDQPIKQRISENTFVFNNFICKYKNSQSVRIQKQTGPNSQLQIQNYLSQKIGNTLKKVTEIKFQQKIFLIEDLYDFTKIVNFNTLEITHQHNNSLTSSSNNTNGYESHKKTILFKKSKKVKSKKLKIKPKRDTKNTVKNFCKAFIKFLLGKENPSIQKMADLAKNNKYNNRLIEILIESQQLCSLFQIFLKQQAQNWLSKSKIKNKKNYYQAIKIYLQLINQKKLNDHKETNDNEASQKEQQYIDKHG